jgi:threonine/homoserine efflux transporter RhtA
VDRHLALLSLLASLWGALSALVGVSMLLLAAGAAAELAEPAGAGLALASGVAATMFGIHLWVASRLRRHQSRGRIVMIALAVCNLVLLPFGTALGAYALWVLLSGTTRKLFEPAPAMEVGGATPNQLANRR